MHRLQQLTSPSPISFFSNPPRVTRLRSPATRVAVGRLQPTLPSPALDRRLKIEAAASCRCFALFQPRAELWWETTIGGPRVLLPGCIVIFRLPPSHPSLLLHTGVIFIRLHAAANSITSSPLPLRSGLERSHQAAATPPPSSSSTSSFFFLSLYFVSPL